MISLAALAVFSGLSLNLLLQFALGTLSAPGGNKERRSIPLLQFGILFASILLLWVLFALVLPPSWKGFPEYFLFFPFSALACMAFERLGEKTLPKLGSHRTRGHRTESRVFHAKTGYDGLLPISLLITYMLAGNFEQAFVLALFFVLGNLAAMLILNEIHRRSTLERVPVFLRGNPLTLISMGLLSLITGAAAAICFRILMF